MNIPSARRCLVIALASWLIAAAGAAQDTFARAKDLYILAAYEDALVLLDRLHDTAPASEATEIAGYQVFCLLALGRTEDAQRAIEALVKKDPLYRPTEATASPRTRAVFEEVRRGLLPGIVQESYDKAKAAFDRKDSQVAAAEFDRVLKLLDEPELANVAAMADLRRLATGFRDLSKAAVPAAPPPAPTASLSPIPPLASPPPASPKLPAVYTATDADVVPPVSITRATPPWHPRNQIEARRQFRGVLEVVVDEKGDVTSATLGKSVHPTYDPSLISMARNWKFRPATKDGTPVKYRVTMEIRLDPRDE
jgi:protein TonB